VANIDKVREFVIEGLLFGEGGQLTDETPFYTLGIVDSMGMLELIRFLEETFGIQLDIDEMIPENIGSLKNIAGFLERKLSGAKVEKE